MRITKLFYLFHSFSVSKQMLKSYWVEKWTNHTICPNIHWTCEHVIPKSLIKEHDDILNLILLPDRLNNARSNYPYIHNNTMNGTIKIINPCYNKKCNCSMTGKLVSNKFFIPADFWKGQISRSVLNMKNKYPYHTELIHKRVLDLNVALEWNETFPITNEEMEWKQKSTTN